MDKIHTRLIHLVNTLEKIVYEPLFNQQNFDAGQWDYVCYGFQEFLAHIQEAHMILNQKRLKFIDVGCGLGSKVHLSKLYFDSYGLELNESYHKVAKEVNTPRLFHTFGRYEDKKDKHRIFKKDALNFDYKPYSVVYFFRPLNKEKLQKQLEQRIFETIKPGTIVVPIYSQSNFPDYMRHLPTPSKQLYMKIHDDDKAKKTHKRIRKLFG